jgi:hypothetical protein
VGVTEEVEYPAVFVGRQEATAGDQLWRCVEGTWEGVVYDYGGVDVGTQPVATVTTRIREEATAGEVADGIKAIYQYLRSAPDWRS